MSSRGRTLAIGAAVAGAVALLALGGPLVDVQRWWPLLLGAAVGLAPGGSIATRGLGLVGGLVVGWGSALAGVALLPATPVGDAIAAGAAVLVVALLAAAARGRVPLWTWLAGLGALAAARPDAVIGVDTPRFADVADAALGLATGVLVAALSGVAAARADAARPPRRDAEPDGEAVAPPDPPAEGTADHEAGAPRVVEPQGGGGRPQEDPSVGGSTA